VNYKNGTVSLKQKGVVLHNARVRDSSGKPTDQWSDNGIGRGLVADSPFAAANTPKIKKENPISF
jgi:hypothetical protein